MFEPLLVAAGKGDLAKVKELVTQGADVNGQSLASSTPLIEATYNGRIEVVKYLLENGANPNVMKKDGATALGFSNKYPDIKELLIKAGAH